MSNKPNIKYLGGDITTKAIFSLSEIFGKINAVNISSRVKIQDKFKPELPTISKNNKVSMKSIASQIKKDYENIFWATGNMDISLYADNCTFADPFSSFGGNNSVQRFKTNADNFSRFIIDPVLKIQSVEIEKDKILVSWIYNSKLKFPWKPVLASSGVTTHYIDQNTGLITKYEERWRSKPWDVIKRLFVPSK